MLLSAPQLFIGVINHFSNPIDRRDFMGFAIGESTKWSIGSREIYSKEKTRWTLDTQYSECRKLAYREGIDVLQIRSPVGWFNSWWASVNSVLRLISNHSYLWVVSRNPIDAYDLPFKLP